MKKVKLLAIVSAVATALLLFLFLSSLNQPTETATTGVLVAASDIPANTSITDAMIKETALPPQALVSGAITDKSQVVGKIANTVIYAGEQLLDAKLVSTGESSNKTLAYAIEPGMRAITIAVSETSGVAYMITPGNNVDIIGEFVSTTTSDANDGSSGKVSYTTMLLENVTVLAVDNVFSQDGKTNSENPAYTTLTLQVTPKQAMVLSTAQFEGELKAILRSPVDNEMTNQPSLTLDDVMVK